MPTLRLFWYFMLHFVATVAVTLSGCGPVETGVLPMCAPAGASYKVYDDSNADELIGNGEYVEFNGQRFNLSRKAPPPAEAERRRALFRESMQLIPRSEWPARIKAQGAAKARVSDYCNFPPYNQAGTNYCWANGPCQAFTVARLQMGLPYRRISSASVGGPITGYRNVGGWELDAIEYLTKTGGTTEDAWPNTGISRNYNTDAVAQDRPNYVALEWVECSGFDEFGTAVLNGFPCAVAYNWWSHVVMLCDLVEISPGRYGFLIRNSWGDWGQKNELGFYGFSVLAEGKGTPSSGFMLRQVIPSARPVISRAASVVETQHCSTAPGDKTRRIVIHAANFNCPPCEAIKREVPALVKAGWNISVIRDPIADEVEGVESYPTTICYRGDREVARIVGFASAFTIATAANRDVPKSSDMTGIFFRRRRSGGGCSGGSCRALQAA